MNWTFLSPHESGLWHVHGDKCSKIWLQAYILWLTAFKFSCLGTSLFKCLDLPLLTKCQLTDCIIQSILMTPKM